MRAPSIILAALCVAGMAQAATGWVTFKTGHSGQGLVQHQIDMSSIQSQGPYRTFWTRLWLPAKKGPLVFSAHERLMFWSQRYAVDCPGRRFGRDFIDSNEPHERRRKASLAAMRWAPLEKFPAVAKAICTSP